VGILLDALRIRGRGARQVVAMAIWIGFGLAMVGIAGAQAVAEDQLGFGPVRCVLVLCGMWVAWSVWHSVLFGRDRLRLLRRGEDAYRIAFVRHIFPGITIGFSQMLRPAWNGVDLRSGTVLPPLPRDPAALVSAVCGLAVFAAAMLLFVSAWRTLGAARVGFVSEFVSPELFEPVTGGPYGAVRHPLFWSGVLVSWSIALINPSPTALAMAAVNTGYGLVYNELEDRRLIKVFGRAYGDYADAVPHILPAASGRRLALRWLPVVPGRRLRVHD